jgi:dipeptidase
MLEMRKFFILMAFILGMKAQACTNIIVAKNASADGSVMVSYNADSYGAYGVMYRHVGGKHQAGEMRKIYEWDTGKYLGEIPQAAVTYNVVGQMNEHQVTVCETTFGGREELADSTGIIDYGSLIYIALERSKTAREAIDVMTSLVAKYGYYSEGETFSIADKNEVWVMEMMGKGPGGHGAVWVAVRIPDDCICCHANQSRITRFDMKDKKNVLYSKDVVKFAREKGYFNGKDADFSFRDAYAPMDFSGARYCEARVWSFFNHWVDGMDKYLDVAMGKNNKGEMPLYFVPKAKLTVADVQNGMRDHYEDTPLDICHDLGAGPYNMPYRPTPLSFTSDGKKYFNERPISTQQTSFAFVGQMRDYLPDAIGGVVWWGNDDANMVAYTPVYCSVNEIPACYTAIKGQQDALTFSWNSAFWVCNLVANMVYPYYSKMMPDLKKVRDELENGYFSQQKEVEAEAKRLYDNDPASAKAYLTDYSLKSSDSMMERWKNLFYYITVKHNDMCIKSEGDGKFLENGHGQAAFPIRPGYPEYYRQQITKQTGDRYLIPEE